jgi:hypothetical protein
VNEAYSFIHVLIYVGLFYHLRLGFSNVLFLQIFNWDDSDVANSAVHFMSSARVIVKLIIQMMYGNKF